MAGLGQNQFEQICNYTIIGTVIIIILITFVILTHLSIATYRQHTTKRHDRANRKSLCLLITTVAGIALFQITNIFTVVVLIKTVIYESIIIKILIPTLDLIAHAAILIVLITRFEFNQIIHLII